MSFTTIRVVEGKRTLVDLATIQLEELQTRIEELARAHPRVPWGGFLILAAQLQGPMAVFRNTAILDAAPEIVARALFTNPAFQPVIAAKGTHTIRVRVAQRTAGVTSAGAPAAAAAEDAIEVVDVRAARAARAARAGPDGAAPRAAETPAAWATTKYQNTAISASLATVAGMAGAVPTAPQVTIRGVIKPLFRLAAAQADFIASAGVAAATDPSPRKHAAPEERRHQTAPPARKKAATPFSEAVQYFMQRLAKAQRGALSLDPVPYELAPMHDFYRLGALNAFQTLLAQGRDSGAVDDFLGYAALNAERDRQSRQLQQKRLEADLLVKQYRLIIEERDLRDRNGREIPATARDPLALLSPRDRELVRNLHAIRLGEIEANLTNTCPHRRPLRRMRSARTADESADALRDLQRFFKPEGPKRKDAKGKPPERGGEAPRGFRICRSCDRPVICPHVEVLVRLRRAAYDDIRAALQPFARREASHDGDAYTYYCRICSERLAEVIEEDRTAELAGRYGDADSGLRLAIWGELAASAEHLRAPEPTDPRQYASAAVDVVYPLVLAAEENLRRRGPRRRETSEEPRLRLYAVLFVYAYALNIIRSSPNVSFEGGEPRGPRRVSSAAEKILEHIIESRRGLISQITDITPDFLSARFAEAFRMVQGQVGVVAFKSVDAEAEVASLITEILPAYRYAATAARVAGALPMAATPVAEFELVTGASLPRLVKTMRENAKAHPALYSKRLHLEIPADTEFEFMYKQPKINLWAHIYPGGAANPKDPEEPAGSQRTRGGAAGRRPKFSPQRSDETLAGMLPQYYAASYRLFVEYLKVASRSARAEYEKHFAIVSAAEAQYLGLKRTVALAPQQAARMRAAGGRAAARAPLASLYDEDGVPHDWSLFVYTRPGGPTKALRRKEVMRERESGALTPGYELADLQCGICAVYQSATGALDEAKIARSLEIANKIDLLFSFYESRCPKGDLHEYLGVEGVCDKCGLRAQLAVDRQASPVARLGGESRRYYDAHEAAFTAERAALAAGGRALAEGPEAEAEAAPEAPAEAPARAVDYGTLIKAAEFGGVPVTVVEALGATEGRDYAEIESGRAAVEPPTQYDAARIKNVQMWARTFIARNVKKMAAPPPPPPPPAPTPAETLNFELERLCRMVLDLGDKAEWLRILRGDKLMSKPGAFNFTIFTEPDEANIGTEFEEVEGAAGEDGSYTAFSLEGMDYDGSNE